MPGKLDYKIKKLEKSPLQRFKNQNLLLKKFGENGIKVYKAITPKKSAEEIAASLGIPQQEFSAIIAYMEEAGMIELVTVETVETVEAPQAPPAEEKKPKKKAKAEEKPVTEEEAIKPIEEIKEEQPKEEKPEKEEEIAPTEIEIKPIEVEEEVPPAEEKKPKKKAKAEEKPVTEEEAIKPIEEIKEEQPKEEKPEKEEEIAPLESPELEKKNEEEAAEPELSPVESIIKAKYGEVGLQIYNLIDGQKTAEEILKETGVTETKLVEILDFMDKQGIIKLEHPAEGKKEERKEVLTEEKFSPMLEESAQLEREYIEKTAEKSVQTVDIPMKAPIDIVKAMQLKAKTLLKFGEKGGKVLDAVDGKNNEIDITEKTGISLYEVDDIFAFLLANKGILLKPLNRTEIRKKYGEDGYTVYKKYGKEGIMLYELIGKEMNIKQMAAMVSMDKRKVVEMFVFIHQLLGVELPIDKEILLKQLGVS